MEQDPGPAKKKPFLLCDPAHSEKVLGTSDGQDPDFDESVS